MSRSSSRCTRGARDRVYWYQCSPCLALGVHRHMCVTSSVFRVEPQLGCPTFLSPQMPTLDTAWASLLGPLFVLMQCEMNTVDGRLGAVYHYKVRVWHTEGGHFVGPTGRVGPGGPGSTSVCDFRGPAAGVSYTTLSRAM